MNQIAASIGIEQMKKVNKVVSAFKIKKMQKF